MDDNPLEDNNGQPASESTCKLRMEQRCCKPKSRICVHHRKNKQVSDNIVEIYPTPMSLMCTQLKRKTKRIELKNTNSIKMPFIFVSLPHSEYSIQH